MKKRIKLTTICFLVIIVFTMILPMNVFATHGFGSQRFRVFVNYLPFEAWGYGSGEIIVDPSLRLRDLAYILNGTPSQFDIIETPDGHWDYWIKRGAPYIIDGTELQPIADCRRALFGSYGFLPGASSPGFDSAPFQNIIIGFDGEDYPDFSISVVAVRDIDDTYFSLYALSYWLGFQATSTWEPGEGYHIHIITEPQTVPTPGHHIRQDTFPIGSRQRIDYAYVLRVRSGPGNHYATKTFVHRGDEFTILDYHGRFVRVETTQSYGWIFAGFLSRRPIMDDTIT